MDCVNDCRAPLAALKRAGILELNAEGLASMKCRDRLERNYAGLALDSRDASIFCALDCLRAILPANEVRWGI